MLERNPDGTVAEAVTPDFYLPETLSLSANATASRSTSCLNEFLASGRDPPGE